MAVISVDPSKRRTGGALLGDRIRMNSIPHRAGVHAINGDPAGQPVAVPGSWRCPRCCFVVAGFDLVILETSGIGQSDTEIVDVADLSVYVMTPEYGAASQLEKIDMLDYADLIAINKADKQGADDALREVRKQFRRNRVRFEGADEDLPVYHTIASDFNDPGTNQLLPRGCSVPWRPRLGSPCRARSFRPCRPTRSTNRPWFRRARVRYLAEVAETIASTTVGSTNRPKRRKGLSPGGGEPTSEGTRPRPGLRLDRPTSRLLENWDQRIDRLRARRFRLHGAGPRGHGADDQSRRCPSDGAQGGGAAITGAGGTGWPGRCKRTCPGSFPFTAGIYPFKRTAEDPTRMFAGEGSGRADQPPFSLSRRRACPPNGFPPHSTR